MSILDVLWRGIAGGMAATVNHRVRADQSNQRAPWIPHLNAERLLLHLGPDLGIPERSERIAIVLLGGILIKVAHFLPSTDSERDYDLAEPGAYFVANRGSERCFDLAEPDSVPRLADYLWTFGVPFAEE